MQHHLAARRFYAGERTDAIVPGTHKSGRFPQDVLGDPFAPHGDEIVVLAPAGSVVVMNTHAWHGGTANHTDTPRRVIHSFYCRGINRSSSIKSASYGRKRKPPYRPNCDACLRWTIR